MRVSVSVAASLPRRCVPCHVVDLWPRDLDALRATELLGIEVSLKEGQEACDPGNWWACAAARHAAIERAVDLP